MVEEERYWVDVLTQIAASQAALDKVALGLLDGKAGNHGAELTNEVLAAAARLTRRG